MLKNLALKKIDKKYADKMFDLLYNSKNLTENYSEKRINLDKEITDKNNINKNIKDNSKNGIYITLMKPENIKSNIVLPSILNSYPNEDDSYKISTLMVNRKGKEIYDQLKTKINLNNNFKSIQNKNIGKLKYKGILPKIKIPKYLTPMKKKAEQESKFKLEFISGFDKNLAENIKNKEYSKITRNQRRNLNYISELQLFNHLDKIREKNKIMNEIKGYTKRKVLLKKDIFEYNKQKWENNPKKSNLNENILDIDKFNNDNQKFLSELRSRINKINTESKDTETDVMIYLNNVDDFINKYPRTINHEYVITEKDLNK